MTQERDKAINIIAEDEEFKEIVKKARAIAYKAPELNINNFSIDDVEELNDAMIKVFNLLDDLEKITITQEKENGNTYNRLRTRNFF